MKQLMVGKSPLVDGTPGFHAMSLFQKSIRRGKEQWALYWARQFWLTGGPYVTWMWRRMLIISGEDIGLADVTVSKTIKDIVKTQQVCWRLIGKSKHYSGKVSGGDIMPIFLAVMVLCRAKKSRALDDAAVWFNQNPKWHPPLDPSAYGDGSTLEKPVLSPEEREAFEDKHCGSREGKDLKHFLEHGAHLENKSDGEGFTPPDHQ